MTALTTDIPSANELRARRKRCLDLLAESKPEAGGLLLFSRVNIYYLTGVLGAGALWVPLDGEPLLFIRKGVERAHLERPELAAVPFRSYSDLLPTAEERGVPFTPVVAVEQDALTWSLAEKLQKRLPLTFCRADGVLARARSVKSSWELALMAEASERHRVVLEELLPEHIFPGMSELEIARLLSDLSYRQGGLGLNRMSAFGEEMLLCETSIGDNGNYPTFYNGPLGCRGAHPASPYLGSAGQLWNKGTLLTVDAGFCLGGYNSDKTRCYVAGRSSDLPSVAHSAHALCCDIEQAVGERMKAGAIPSELYALSLRMAEKAGFAEGFMGIGGNKVPFLGHSIGLCIDEWPVLARRFDGPLENGTCMALEPKVGIPGIGMVGVENVWAVTTNKGVPLSSGRRDMLFTG